MAYVLKIDDEWVEGRREQFVVTQGNGCVFTPMFSDPISAWLFANYFSKHYAYRIEDYNESRQEEIAQKATEIVDQIFGEDRKLKVDGPVDPDWDEADYKENGEWVEQGEKDSLIAQDKEFEYSDLADSIRDVDAIDRHGRKRYPRLAERAEWVFEKFVDLVNPPPKNITLGPISEVGDGRI
jgi:hypothetical protein